jgi:hypothetical protein
MGLYHNFLIGEFEISYGELLENLSKDTLVKLHDDFISYIWDSMCWLSTDDMLKSGSRPKKGLSRWGITRVHGDSLKKFARIIGIWKDLFLEAPSEVVLTGSYSFDDNPEGAYEKLVYNKDYLVNMLTQLVKICEFSIDNDKCVYHYGI